MKKLFFLCLILVSFNTIAQKLVTYIKIERTPCYGRCPVYSLEIMSNGKIKSNKKNTRSGEITVGSNHTGNYF